MEALSNMYEKPSAANKVFMIRELVNTRMKEDSSVIEHINKTNSILARLMSVGIKFDDQVQALLLLSSLPDSWSGTVTAVPVQRDPMDSLLRRFVILFLARTFEEGVLGNHLVNRYMSSEVRKISEIMGARTKEGVSQRLEIAQV